MSTGFTVMDALNKNSKAGADETPRARFRTRDISIHKMYRNEMNFYSLDDIDQLAREILLLGLQQNLEVAYEPTEKGEYRIIAGERRWLALRRLVEQGYKEFEIVTCKVVAPQDEDEEQIEIIIANAYRRKKPSDIIEEERRLAKSLKNMKQKKQKIKGYDLTSGRLRDIIADMLHTSATKVAQIEAINNNLIPELREEAERGRITFSAAYELAGMSEDKQKEMLEQYRQTGELIYKDVKMIKGAAVEQEKEGEINTDKGRENNETVGDEQIENEGTENKRAENERAENERAENERAGQQWKGVSESDTEVNEYQTPHPEGITSLCYSCTEYETCNVKTGTCTKCDQYKNRAEAYKTEEQRYSEEQDRIDKETAKRFREQADEEKMNNLPSDTQENGQKVHHIKLGASFFEEVITGRKTFELRKNDRNYKKGDILEMEEFKDGKSTGRMVRVLVTYILTEFTGLEEGYCIMATSLLAENEKK